MTKSLLRDMISGWYQVEDDHFGSDDDFLRGWVPTLVDDSISGNSDWSREIEYIIMNCKGAWDFPGVNMVYSRKGNYYNVSTTRHVRNTTKYISLGRFFTLVDAVKAQRCLRHSRA